MAERDIQLGELIGAVKAINGNLEGMRKEFQEERKDASKKRADMHDKIDALRGEISPLKATLQEYEPDLRRCRMLRHFGIVSLALISAGGVVAGFWDKLVGLFK